MLVDGSLYENFFVEVYTGHYQGRGVGSGVGGLGEEAMSCMSCLCYYEDASGG